MRLTNAQTLVTILAIAAGTMLTRFLPFALFPENKRVPRSVLFLGRVLPPSMIGLLVVYSLRDVSITVYPYGLPALLSIGLIVILHLWRRNTLLSIAGGTALYMVLMQGIL